MKNENFVHIRIDSNEALQSKKDILFSEISLIKAIKIMQEYKALRLNELEAKGELLKKIKEIKSSLKSLEVTLPKVKMSKILEAGYKKESDEEEKSIKGIPKIKPRQEHEDPLETQLREIQERLGRLG